MPIHHEINPDEDDRESLIVMLEPYTHKQFLYLFFDRLERVNQTYEDEVQSLTEENLREAMTRATPGEHLVCLLLRYPNKVMIPYGSSLFAADDLDSIVNGAHQCLDMIRDANEGELLFRHVHYTYNKLVAFTIGCVCNVKLLEEQLARAQAQLKLR
ncbi:MAG: hypothetical protein EBT32_10895 [Betaproteobacteria bacterium]|nr:hypothetical protein [Betaproteobacteria bacterium]